MRAVGFTSFGGPEVVSVLDIVRADPGPGQVRVRVRAAPVQPADLAVRSGAFGPMIPPGTYILGWDVAGDVDAIGPGVDDLKPGQAVIGLSQWLTSRIGTQAEFVVLDASAVVAAPAGTDPIEASTLPANALTAIQGIDRLGLTAGQTLAVTGAGGAVGGYAVEVARNRGLTVIGLAGPQDREFLLGRGAIPVLRSADPAAAVRSATPEGVDGLFDAAVLGGAVLPAVRDGGSFVSVMPPATPVTERGIRVETVVLHVDTQHLRDVAAQAENGTLTPRVAAVHPFEGAAEAHELFAKGGVRGRVVLVP